jgi:hypothetical protein
MEQHVDDGVGFPLVRRAHGGEPPACDGIGLIEEQHRILTGGRAEHGSHMLGGLSHPAGLQLGIADDE